MSNIIIASIIDFFLGDPYSFPHPVKLMGRVISFEDKLAHKITKNKNGLKFIGLIVVLLNVSLVFLIPYYLLRLLKDYKVIYAIVNIYLIYTCIAAKCLDFEATKVYEALNEGLEGARKRLSYIVGRDTRNLKEDEIIKATIETVAENTSDGVIAPLLYIFILGAPGGLAYKMVNTMDSMIGYMNERYIDLGYFPAKIDDVVNYIPARITGLLMCLGSIFRFDARNGLKIMIRDRKNHKSPNASYPEGATAGLLKIQLGGDNIYHGKLVEKPTIGDRIKEVERLDIKKTIEIMYRSEILLLFIYVFYKLFVEL